MFLDTTIILVAMVATFVISTIVLKSPEISMVITGIVGVIFGAATAGSTTRRACW